MTLVQRDVGSRLVVRSRHTFPGWARWYRINQDTAVSSPDLDPTGGGHGLGMRLVCSAIKCDTPVQNGFTDCSKRQAALEQ